MQGISGRARLLLAVAAAAALGGLAAGIVLTRGGAESALAQGPPGVVARGSFRSVHAGTVGTVKLVRDSSGALRLRFGPGFSTQRAPELFVYLVRGSSRRELAPLRSTTGAQEYALPSNLAGLSRSSVEVVCAKCNATYGRAQLEPTSRTGM
ncbi:MAG: DM13 domain-containing protein [Gaiellaceae bacterium]